MIFAKFIKVSIPRSIYNFPSLSLFLSFEPYPCLHSYITIPKSL